MRRGGRRAKGASSSPALRVPDKVARLGIGGGVPKAVTRWSAVSAAARDLMLATGRAAVGSEVVWVLRPLPRGHHLGSPADHRPRW
jgi:hypothetical protein